MSIEKNQRIEYTNNKNGRCILTAPSANNFKPQLYLQFSGSLTNKAHRRRLHRVLNGALQALERCK